MYLLSPPSVGGEQGQRLKVLNKDFLGCNCKIKRGSLENSDQGLKRKY